jgi:hypothetical protein
LKEDGYFSNFIEIATSYNYHSNLCRSFYKQVQQCIPSSDVAIIPYSKENEHVYQYQNLTVAFYLLFGSILPEFDQYLAIYTS